MSFSLQNSVFIQNQIQNHFAANWMQVCQSKWWWININQHALLIWTIQESLIQSQPHSKIAIANVCTKCVFDLHANARYIIRLHRNLQTTNRWLLSSQQLIPCTEPWNLIKTRNMTRKWHIFFVIVWRGRMHEMEIIDIRYEQCSTTFFGILFHVPI